jgi:hypothetical protein
MASVLEQEEVGASTNQSIKPSSPQPAHRKSRKILWLSRHAPTPKQLARLEALYGADVQVEADDMGFRSAAEIAERFKQSGADEVVLVAPLSVTRALCEHGVYPLRAKMEPCAQNDPDMEVRLGRRWYRFIRFTRIKAINIEEEEVVKP